jgi:hypothetical protein
MFSSENHETVIKIDEFDYITFVALLRFIYCGVGKMDDLKDISIDLLKAADRVISRCSFKIDYSIFYIYFSFQYNLMKLKVGYKK